MATQQIPAKKVTICDMCGKDSQGYPHQFKHECKFNMTGHAFDWGGHAVASDSVSMDFCDGCRAAVGQAVNEIAVERKAKFKEAKGNAAMGLDV